MADSERYWSLDPIPAPLSGWVEKCPSCQHIFRPLKGNVTNHRLMSWGIPRQFGRTICPNCHRNIQFLLRKSGLLFNAEVPAVIIEEDRVAIVEIRDPDQIKVGDRSRHCAKLVQKSQSRIHPDHLLLINLDLDATENYVSFAKLQRQVYQVVKLIRCPDSQRWLVDELCPMLG